MSLQVYACRCPASLSWAGRGPNATCMRCGGHVPAIAASADHCEADSDPLGLVTALQLDATIYGFSVVAADGRRIDPLVVAAA